MPILPGMSAREHLRKAREIAGVTQAALSIAAGLHPNAVARYECDRPFTPKAAALLAKALLSLRVPQDAVMAMVDAARSECRQCAAYDGVADALGGRR